MKVFTFKYKDKEVELPLQIIAEHRATRLAEFEALTIDDLEYELDVKAVLEDPYKGLIWLLDEMEPIDFKDLFIKEGFTEDEVDKLLWEKGKVG